ncbi:MAG TPA: cupin domain-containing protein [Thermomicrobiales bacterium]
MEEVAIASDADAESARRVRKSANILIDGDASGGQFAIVETHAAYGIDPPCHIHSHEDEVVYVLAGRALVQVGELFSSIGAGECLYLPRGCEHAILAESPEARLLLITLPAGIEGYYRELDLASDAEVDDVERQIAVAARYGLTITGPAMPRPA